MSTGNPGRAQAEALVNLLTNGALDRVDQRGKRARELYQWGLHPHHAEPGSPLADNAAFEEAYPLALSGGVGVTEEALFPMMNASENLNAAGILIEERPNNGNVLASSIMQLCRSAMESSAKTIWLLSSPDRGSPRPLPEPPHGQLPSDKIDRRHDGRVVGVITWFVSRYITDLYLPRIPNRRSHQVFREAACGRNIDRCRPYLAWPSRIRASGVRCL